MRKALVLLALLTAIVGLALALTSSPEDRIADVDYAIVAAEVNENSAESAPQQQVVNGWVARDLLEVQARQLDDIASGQRTLALVLGLVGLTVALGVLALVTRPTTPAPPAPAPATPSGQSVPH